MPTRASSLINRVEIDEFKSLENHCQEELNTTTETLLIGVKDGSSITVNITRLSDEFTSKSDNISNPYEFIASSGANCDIDTVVGTGIQNLQYRFLGDDMIRLYYTTHAFSSTCTSEGNCYYLNEKESLQVFIVNTSTEDTKYFWANGNTNSEDYYTNCVDSCTPTELPTCVSQTEDQDKATPTIPMPKVVDIDVVDKENPLVTYSW